MADDTRIPSIGSGSITTAQFAAAAGRAALEYYAEGVPDGVYLKIEPVPHDTKIRLAPVPPNNLWPAQFRHDYVMAWLVTDMYGHHPTVVGAIVQHGPEPAIAWQE